MLGSLVMVSRIIIMHDVFPVFLFPNALNLGFRSGSGGSNQGRPQSTCGTFVALPQVLQPGEISFCILLR